MATVYGSTLFELIDQRFQSRAKMVFSAETQETKVIISYSLYVEITKKTAEKSWTINANAFSYDVTCSGSSHRDSGSYPSTSFTVATSAMSEEKKITTGTFTISRSTISKGLTLTGSISRGSSIGTSSAQAQITVPALNKYLVTFNMQGHGDQIGGQSVYYGHSPEEPTEPTAMGYTFGGWYKEAACTNAFDFSEDVITKATTLYAKWTLTSKVYVKVNGAWKQIPEPKVKSNGSWESAYCYVKVSGAWKKLN